MKIQSNKNILLFISALTILGLGSNSFADDNNDHANELSTSGIQRAYVGVLIGGDRSASSDGTISESATSPTLGITGGFKLSPLFGIGFLGSRYGMTSSTTILGLPVGTNSSTTLLLAQGNFTLGAIHLGAEVGTSTISWDGKLSSLNDGTSNTSMVYGPHGGIDFKIDPTISLGGEFHYLFSTAKNAVNEAQALAALKVWL